MTAPAPRDNERNTAYYSALVQAWFTTRIERDRTLLALSAGGLALLVTLLTAFGARSPCVLILHVVASLVFLAALICGIAVLGRNAVYLEAEKVAFESGDQPRGDDLVLVRLDTAVMGLFILGVLLTLAIGVSSVLVDRGEEVARHMETKNKAMLGEQEKTEKSFTGASNMRPNTPGSGGSTGQGSGPEGGSGGATTEKPGSDKK